jgi:hypothetical protein
MYWNIIVLRLLLKQLCRDTYNIPKIHICHRFYRSVTTNIISLKLFLLSYSNIMQSTFIIQILFCSFRFAICLKHVTLAYAFNFIFIMKIGLCMDTGSEVIVKSNLMSTLSDLRYLIGQKQTQNVYWPMKRQNSNKSFITSKPGLKLYYFNYIIDNINM